MVSHGMTKHSAQRTIAILTFRIVPRALHGALHIKSMLILVMGVFFQWLGADRHLYLSRDDSLAPVHQQLASLQHSAISPSSLFLPLLRCFEVTERRGTSSGVCARSLSKLGIALRCLPNFRLVLQSLQQALHLRG
jgi:hypothetical protein